MDSNNNTIRRELSLKKVVDLLNETPEKIILTVESPHFGFGNYLRSETMGADLIKHFASLFNKMLACNSMPGKLNSLISQFVQSNYYRTHLYDAIFQKSRENTYDLNLIKTTLSICHQCFERNPFLVLGPVRDRIELLCLRLNDPELREQFEQGLVKLEEAEALKIQKKRDYTFPNLDTRNMEPPNDFTEMNIEPKLVDILSDQEPFLRENISNGAYRNVHHYLDVQFRLLREDYLRPLREGVSKFREIVQQYNINYNISEVENLSSEMRKKLRSIDSLSIYFGTTVHSTKLTDIGIVYQIKLRQEAKKKEIDWEYSKKLIFGSMVCFSNDNFMSNCLVGIVCDRELADLKKNLIGIRFNYDSVYKSNNESFPNTNKVYTMLETSAFFESYKHVLDSLVALRNLDDESFPFKKHIGMSYSK